MKTNPTNLSLVTAAGGEEGEATSGALSFFIFFHHDCAQDSILATKNGRCGGGWLWVIIYGLTVCRENGIVERKSFSGQIILEHVLIRKFLFFFSNLKII